MTDTTKIRAKLTKIDKSLDELEAQLEPLFAQSLPETLLALDTIQQAKLQVIIPYVVYDLVFVYLKSRGIDPKTHRVVAELERVREYFDKIKHAEDSEQKRKLGIDKGAAERFIKRAIAQAKNAQSVDEPPDAATATSSSSNHEQVPVKVTSKMMARAEYEEELKELGSEEEEDLGMFDEEPTGGAMDTLDDVPEGTRSTRLEKGKGRASEMEQSRGEEILSSKRKRPRVDPFSGYENPSFPKPTSRAVDHINMATLVTPVQSSSADDSSRGVSVPVSESREAKKAAKKAKRKAKEA